MLRPLTSKIAVELRQKLDSGLFLMTENTYSDAEHIVTGLESKLPAMYASKSSEYAKVYNDLIQELSRVPEYYRVKHVSIIIPAEGLTYGIYSVLERRALLGILADSNPRYIKQLKERLRLVNNSNEFDFFEGRTYIGHYQDYLDYKGTDL